MKHRICTLVMFSMLVGSIMAQKKQGVNLSFSTLGYSHLYNEQRSTDPGAPSVNSIGFYGFGLGYERQVWRAISLETGLEYGHHTIKVDPTGVSYGNNYPPYNRSIALFTVPAVARLTFLKYFFVNGGLLFDFDANASGRTHVDNQSGIGALVGIGAEYNFYKNYGVFFNGYTKFHTLQPFVGEMNSGRFRLSESACRFGLMYEF